MLVRDAEPNDQAAWRHLWIGYNSFYDAPITDEVTDRTWQRIINPASPIFARLAVTTDKVVGFSVSVLHEGTWTISPICYLEDLFVDPSKRGHGVGRLLIQDLVDRAKSNGWSRLYWHTRADNPARNLFDRFVKVDGFVRYRMMFG